MKDDDDAVSTWQDKLPAPSSNWRKWLVIGGIALAFMFTLGVGAFLGSTVGVSQAAGVTSVSNTSAQTFTNQSGSTTNAQSQNGPQGMQGMPGGRCGSLTVSSVNGNTIVAKSPNGSSITIHTTASTKYTQSGKTVSASAIKSGEQLQVMGTHNSDGSITATSIVIG